MQLKDKKVPDVTVTFNKKTTKENFGNVKNAGYLYLKQACLELGLDKICKKIKDVENIRYNLFEILSFIIFNKLICMEQNISTVNFSKTLLEEGSFTSEEVENALSVFAKYNVEIQTKLYKRLTKLLNVDSSIMFYDCTNYSTINNQLYKSRGIEYPQDEITITKVLFDANGFPCLFSLENNVNKRYDDYEQINKFITKNFKKSVLYVFPDSLRASTDSNLFKFFFTTKHLRTQSVKNFTGELREWALDPNGWHAQGSTKKYNLKDIEDKINDNSTSEEEVANLKGMIFYKIETLRISIPNTDMHITQNLILTFNFELKEWETSLRESQIMNLQKSVETRISSSNTESFAEKYKKLLHTETINMDTTSTDIYYFNDNALRKDEIYDGYYVIYENSDNQILQDVLKVMETRLDQIDYVFRSVKKDCKKTSKISQEDNMISHYLTSMIALTVFKYLSYYLGNKYSNAEILNALKSMNLVRIADCGWTPTFNINSVIKTLTKIFDIDLCYDFLTDDQVKSL